MLHLETRLITTTLLLPLLAKYTSQYGITSIYTRQNLAANVNFNL